MKIAKTKRVETPRPNSAGLSFFIPEDFGSQSLGPGGAINIPSGVHVVIPKGYALIAMNNTGVALKKGLIVGACVFNESYQDEIHLHVINVGKNIIKIKGGDALVQMLLVPVLTEAVESCALKGLYR